MQREKHLKAIDVDYIVRYNGHVTVRQLLLFEKRSGDPDTLKFVVNAQGS